MRLSKCTNTIRCRIIDDSYRTPYGWILIEFNMNVSVLYLDTRVFNHRAIITSIKKSVFFYFDYAISFDTSKQFNHCIFAIRFELKSEARTARAWKPLEKEGKVAPKRVTTLVETRSRPPMPAGIQLNSRREKSDALANASGSAWRATEKAWCPFSSVAMGKGAEPCAYVCFWPLFLNVKMWNFGTVTRPTVLRHRGPYF